MPSMVSLRTSIPVAAALALQLLGAAAQDGADNACAKVVKQQEKAVESIESKRPGDLLFALVDAKTAYECVSNVPLNSSDALKMIDVVKGYSVFQTTLAYLKDPPESYQQPAVDVMDRLDKMAKKVEDDEYDGQYDFDVDMHAIFIDAHDSHFVASLGVVGLFSWILPDTLISVSSDGKKLPEVYAKSDVLRDIEDASPIVEIEDESVFTYLQSYASRTAHIGSVDPHGDWNKLMWSPMWQFNRWGIGTSSYWPAYFEMTLVYNGPSISGRFANGSTFEWEYQAGTALELDMEKYNSSEAIAENLVRESQTSLLNGMKVRRDDDNMTPTGISDGEDFEESGNFTSIPLPHYPDDPVVIQPGVAQGGLASGYLLSDDAVGVLSLPTFLQTPIGNGTELSDISDLVEEFIEKVKDAGAKKIVIDVSGNTGGNLLVSYVVFKLFFPQIEPSLLYRTRASSAINTIGSMTSKIYEVEQDENADKELEEALLELPMWYDFIHNRIALSSSHALTKGGKSWSSWEDYYGPVKEKGDNFTNPTTYNLTYALAAEALDDYIDLANGDEDMEQPWDAEDIIILDDGSCGSACAIFSELMRIDAGVRVVAVGGIPQNGPMQAMMGTRGGNVLVWEQASELVDIMRDLSENSSLETLMEEAGVTTEDIDNLPPNIRGDAPWDVRSAGVNLLDTLRKDSPDAPLQFAYQAADCRLFYTAEMMRDVTKLWLAVAKIAEGDMSACVPGSTNAPGVSGGDPVMKSPGFSGEETWEKANSTETPTFSEKPRGPLPTNENGDDDEDTASFREASLMMVVMLAALVVGVTSF